MFLISMRAPHQSFVVRVSARKPEEKEKIVLLPVGCRMFPQRLTEFGEFTNFRYLHPPQHEVQLLKNLVLTRFAFMANDVPIAPVAVGAAAAGHATKDSLPWRHAERPLHSCLTRGFVGGVVKAGRGLLKIGT